MRIWHQKSATRIAAMAITLLANTAQGQYLDLPEPGSLGPCFELQAFKKGYEVVADYDYRSYVEGMAGQYQWTTIVRSMGVAKLEGKPVWLFLRQDTERITAPHTTVQYTYIDLDVTKGLKPLAQT